ncbi:MAG: radical SAM protein [Methylococcales bacterium]|nr:radical SAM protein [Methylococcales bacterium]
MSCKYCYLGELTEQKNDAKQMVATLDFALKQLLDSGYLPFNLSFHGGEVTVLPTSILDQLFGIAHQYYQQYNNQIKSQGFKVNPLHIKTNLLNFKKHYDVLSHYKVSISASIDLPLSLHEKYRRDKNNNSTLKRIVDNLKLLANYPHNHKTSCVVTQQHLLQIDDFIHDIKYLHFELGLDMSRFNVMFAFDSTLNQEKFNQQVAGCQMLTGQQQLQFYDKIKAAFMGTVLENAFHNEWFKEFTPDYCCSAVNCGDKFFLLQADGNVYSCPRGQSSESYCYGNIFEDEVDDIISNGWQVIERNENTMEVDDDCLNCCYMPYCNVGCTFVRQQTGAHKSYTCQLQQAIYQDNPEKYRPLMKDEIQQYSQRWLLQNNLKRLQTHYPQASHFVTPELREPSNQLSELVKNDAVLKQLYATDLFYLKVNGVHYDLHSPLLKNERDIEIINADSEIFLAVRQDIFKLNCEFEVNNHLILMMLRDTTVVYGDEQRNKQEHIFDYAIYHNSFFNQAVKQGNHYIIDISAIIKLHGQLYLPDIRNNLFFTTRNLREYHYQKQRKNAFYHLQAINLPFQNIEFIWQTS